jgi:hypothetical protein
MKRQRVACSVFAGFVLGGRAGRKGAGLKTRHYNGRRGGLKPRDPARKVGGADCIESSYGSVVYIYPLVKINRKHKKRKRIGQAGLTVDPTALPSRLPSFLRASRVNRVIHPAQSMTLPHYKCAVMYSAKARCILFFMAYKLEPCPACGGLMGLRSDTYTCEKCGHFEQDILLRDAIARDDPANLKFCNCEYCLKERGGKRL